MTAFYIDISSAGFSLQLDTWLSSTEIISFLQYFHFIFHIFFAQQLSSASSIRFLFSAYFSLSLRLRFQLIFFSSIRYWLHFRRVISRFSWLFSSDIDFHFHLVSAGFSSLHTHISLDTALARPQLLHSFRIEEFW